MTQPKKKTTPARKTKTNPSANLRERVLDDAQTLKVPLSAEMLDAALARAEQEGLSHLDFLELILGEPAARSRQRAIERRIREANFRDDRTSGGLRLEVQRQAIDRAQIEQLATGEFIRRHENLVMVGQSGVGKSHLLQALGRRSANWATACVTPPAPTCWKTCGRRWPTRPCPAASATGRVSTC